MEDSYLTEKVIEPGDKVKIRKDSEFVKENKNWGEVCNIKNEWASVKFADGYITGFPIADLDLLEVGQRIVMNKLADHYVHTKQASEGIITRFVANGCLEVKFDKITGSSFSMPYAWVDIYAVDVDIINNGKSCKSEENGPEDDCQTDLHLALCSWLNGGEKNGL